MPLWHSFFVVNSLCYDEGLLGTTREIAMRHEEF